MTTQASPTRHTGRCYCGASSLIATIDPSSVAYCHCTDCRRVTGAPVAAFAQFHRDAVSVQGAFRAREANGVTRRFCGSCGSPLLAEFAYLPGQVYIPVGCLDTSETLSPDIHCHDSSRLSWLCLSDDLPRVPESARKDLLIRGNSA